LVEIFGSVSTNNKGILFKKDSQRTSVLEKTNIKMCKTTKVLLFQNTIYAYAYVKHEKMFHNNMYIAHELNVNSKEKNKTKRFTIGE